MTCDGVIRNLREPSFAAQMMRPAAAVVLEVDNQQSWLHCPIRELGTNLLQT